VRHRDKISGKAMPGLYEITIVKKDGDIAPVELTGAYTIYQNQPANVLYIRDITQRKIMEKALKEEKENYRSFVENAPVALWEWDDSEAKKYIDSLKANGTTDFKKYFEENPDEVGKCISLCRSVQINKAAINIREASDREQLTEYLKNPRRASENNKSEFIIMSGLASGDSIISYDYEYVTFKGNHKYMHAEHLIAPGFEDTWARVFVASFDITGRKKAEEELKAYQEHLEELIDKRTSQLEMVNRSLLQEVELRKLAEQKSQQLYKNEGELRRQLEKQLMERAEYTRALVHELKTPLTPLIASSDYLMQNAGDGHTAIYAKNINAGASNLSRRIDELLDLAKGESGMLRLQPELVNLNNIIFEIVEYMNLEALKNNQIITADLPIETCTVRADDNRLRQILINLLGNALKYTRKGGGVHLKLTKRAEDLLIQVQDNGCGIDEELKKVIFEPYARSVCNKQYSGLGLGLVLCKMFVELHGGQIWVESEKGKGSTFSFTLPLTLLLS
jgi:signal transduction histidine kinase